MVYVQRLFIIDPKKDFPVVTKNDLKIEYITTCAKWKESLQHTSAGYMNLMNPCGSVIISGAVP